jgi:hypothetical protein
MKTESPAVHDNRCVRQFADGRRCRMLRKRGHDALCVFHANEEQQLLETDKLAREFASLSGKFLTAIDINHVLGKVFDALAQKLISQRAANTFGYLAQLMLQSVPGVRREINGATHNPRAYDHMVRDTIPYFRPAPEPPDPDDD